MAGRCDRLHYLRLARSRVSSIFVGVGPLPLSRVRPTAPKPASFAHPTIGVRCPRTSRSCWAHIILAVSLVLPSILLPSRCGRGAQRSNRKRPRPVAAVGPDARHDRHRDRARSDRGRPRPDTRVRAPPATVAARGPHDLLHQPCHRVLHPAPNLRRLIGIRAAADDKTWLERAKRQRYVSYLMAGLVGTIGYLMSSKPVLW